MAEPKISPPIQAPTAPNADVPSVVTGPKEQGNVVDISDYLKPSEQVPNFPPEVGKYLTSSENLDMPHEIIKSNIEIPSVIQNQVTPPPLPAEPETQDNAPSTISIAEVEEADKTLKTDTNPINANNAKARIVRFERRKWRRKPQALREVA